MIAGQAIKGTGMDPMASTGLINSNHSYESSSTKRKDSVSFESLLSNKAVSNQAMSLQNSDKAITDVSYKSETKSTKDLTNRDQTVETRSTPKRNVNDETVKHVAKDSEATDNSKLEKVAKVINEVKEEVMKTLQVSEEELVSMMEVLGLTMIDLLDQAALKQLTLENAGTNDLMMLLTDEGLNQQFTNLLDQIQGILDKYGISQSDLANLGKQDSEFAKLLEVFLADEKNIAGIDDLQDDISLNPNTQEGKGITTTESNIEFTVERVTQEEGASSQNSTNADSNQNKEQGYTKTELTNQFLNQMVNSTTSAQGDFSMQAERLNGIREIASQVLEQIKLIIKPTQTSMEFMLNPENLGKVALNITSKEGLLTATFTTENQLVKEAIESQLQIFKENLNNQGIKVEAIEVNVSNFSFEGSTGMEQSNGNQQEAAKNKKSGFRMDSGDEDFLEEAIAELVNDSEATYGNNFDYTA